MFTLYHTPFRGVSCIKSMNSNSPGWHKSFVYIEHRAGEVGQERRSRIRSRKWSQKSAYDLVKTKNLSRKRSHKRDGILVSRTRTFQFSSDSAYDSVVYDLVFSLYWSETTQFSLDPKRRSRKRNQWNADFTRS